MIEIESNWSAIVTELKKTNRDGIENLINYLEHDTDFKTAPASTKFHLCEMGGLAEHSLNVLRFARLVNTTMDNICPDNNIIIAALMHDLCKTNYYVMGEEWDKDWKEKTNQWRKKKIWKVEEKEPLGHGEKSVILANRHIQLTTEEMAAIRWHMTGFDAGIHFNYPSGFPYRESMNRYPLLKVIILGDEMAELYESTHYNTEG